jgi:hypothetical protein
MNSVVAPEHEHEQRGCDAEDVRDGFARSKVALRVRVGAACNAVTWHRKDFEASTVRERAGGPAHSTRIVLLAGEGVANAGIARGSGCRRER